MSDNLFFELLPELGIAESIARAMHVDEGLVLNKIYDVYRYFSLVGNLSAPQHFFAEDGAIVVGVIPACNLSWFDTFFDLPGLRAAMQRVGLLRVRASGDKHVFGFMHPKIENSYERFLELEEQRFLELEEQFLEESSLNGPVAQDPITPPHLPLRARSGRANVAALAPGNIDSTAATHAEDFSSVLWFGTLYTFSIGLQSESVKILWEAWTKGTPILHEATIGGRAGSGSSSFQLSKVFRSFDRATGKFIYHPAWNTMIKRTGKGQYALASPREEAIPF
ncbi:MAG TPA: hypothetical protein VFE62_27135 [Gemmataceae bacterium]|nr:hypothetical protein [Gemmataceae bacterium]